MLQAPLISRFQVISVLTRIRQEWETAAEGQSLLDVEGNIGMLLGDMVNALALTTDEQSVVLGSNLCEEMQKVLDLPSKTNRQQARPRLAFQISSARQLRITQPKADGENL